MPKDQTTDLHSRIAEQLAQRCTELDHGPDNDHGPDTTATETLSTILGHRSCRAYLPDEVPQPMLDMLVAAAQSAPSSCNLQAWSLVIVRDPAQKEALRRISDNQRQIAESPVFLCFLADLDRLGRVAAGLGRTDTGLDYLEMTLSAALDATLAAQNLATAAASMGLGTCYIGELRNDIAAAARLLNLPPRVVPVFGMCLGWPDPDRPTQIKPRLPARAVVHHDTYHRPDDATLAEQVAEYDAALGAFDRAQGRDTPSWSVKSTGRIDTVASLKGREDFLSRLRDMGLALK